MLNFSEACERNKQVIFQQLRDYLRPGQRVLEIGSGSGQHAIYFNSQIGGLAWQCTELSDNLQALAANLAHFAKPDLAEPRALDVTDSCWELGEFDLVYSANTLHIMGWAEVEHLFRGVGEHLNVGGCLIVYGPFRYGGAYTSSSNEHFDSWLKSRDRRSGIRDFEAVNQQAQQQGLELVADISMPANNQLLVWRR